MPLVVLDIELIEKNIIKELRFFLMVLCKYFHFVHQRLLNLTNRRHGTLVIYMELRGVLESWIMRSCFAAFYDIKVMRAKVFAEGLEKCRLLTNLLGQNVENLDDYGCPKIQHLVKTDSWWICSSYPFRYKTRPHCAERKAKVYEEWVMQHLYFFVRVYCICLYY